MPFPQRLTPVWPLSFTTLLMVLGLVSCQTDLSESVLVPASDTSAPSLQKANISGQLLSFSSSRDGWFDVYVMKAEGKDVTQITNGTPPEFYGRADWSPDQRMMTFTRVAPDENGVWKVDICVMNSNGSSIRALPLPGAAQMSRWSPDGSKIVCSMAWEGGSQITLINVDGSGLTVLTHVACSNESPFWSPEGQKIVFQSDRTGTRQIFVMNADGSDLLQVTNGPGDNISPAWSPLGNKIAFSSNRDGNFEIYLMNIDGTGPLRLTTAPSNEDQPAWSPDGSRLAFITDRYVSPSDSPLPNYEIFVMNADGTGQKRVTFSPGFDSDPVWAITSIRLK